MKIKFKCLSQGGGGSTSTTSTNSTTSTDSTVVKNEPAINTTPNNTTQNTSNNTTVVKTEEQPIIAANSTPQNNASNPSSIKMVSEDEMLKALKMSELKMKAEFEEKEKKKEEENLKKKNEEERLKLIETIKADKIATSVFAGITADWEKLSLQELNSQKKMYDGLSKMQISEGYKEGPISGGIVSNQQIPKPTLTGDPIKDYNLMCEYDRKVAKLQAQKQQQINKGVK